MMSQQLADGSWTKPVVCNLSDAAGRAQFEALQSGGTVARTFDRIDLAIDELYDIEHPDQKDNRDDTQHAEFVGSFGDLGNYGSWVFYPWSGDLVHFPSPEHLLALRTSRNRNLIRAEEQKTLATKTVLIVGLSVGSNVAETLLTEAIGGTYILVDLDILEPTNLNRIKASYKELGVHKVDVMAKRISELDPYAKQIHYRDGLDEAVLVEILEKHTPDVIVDEMDSLEMKLHLRDQAKKHRLPVIMATDDGENALLDIERYDKEADAPIFHGLLPDPVLTKLRSGTMSRPEIGMAIGQYFVGPDNIPLRMFESLVEVGKSLPSWPQLGGAATLSGVLVAYAVKKVLLDQPLNAGHHLFSLDELLDPEIHTAEHQVQLARYKAGPPRNG
jgi:molybdopterin/thiamine biosynthesis adenylyltransferase